ncbi:dTDP-4-dehydrorhamnose reductase [Chloroflexota bacterium]
MIGAKGQLGTALCNVLQGSDVIPFTHEDLEICNFDLVKQVLSKYKPNVIVNTAAYVQVNNCEIKQDKAFSVNAMGARNVAVVAHDIEAKLVHIGTDYVFGGDLDMGTIPYTEFNHPAPVNLYGKSKLAGENLVRHLCSRYFIVRSSGLFGTSGASDKGGNFVETVLKIAKEKDELKVVNDQVFSPTYARDLAKKIAQLINTEYYGIFHITNSGACSWYEFAKDIIKLAKLDIPIIPITSAQYPQEARRPCYSVLDNYHLRLLGMDAMRSWQEALCDYMKEKGYLKVDST